LPDTKVSLLTHATIPLAGTERVPISDGTTVSKYATVNELSIANTVTAAETAAGVTPTNLAFSPAPWLDIRRYGAISGGSTDCSTAFANACLVAAAGFGLQECSTTVYVPPGDWKVITGFFLRDRVGLLGEGHISRIMYAPAADGTLITVQHVNTALQTNFNTIRRVRLYSSDNTYVKTAVDTIDTNACTIAEINVDGSINRSGALYWADPTFTSTGIKTNGRQAYALHDAIIYADIPIYIGTNPNSTISCDLHNFHNITCSTKTNVATQGVINVQDGANLSSVSFTGSQSWIGAYHGFYWNDTLSSQVSYAINIANARREQGTNVLGYDFYLHHNTNVQTLKFECCHFVSASAGNFSFRKINAIHLSACAFTPASGKAQFDTDNSVWALQLSACLSSTAGINGITGMNLVRSAGLEPSTSIHPNDAMYVTTALNSNYDQIFPNGTRGTSVTVADATIVLLRLRNCAGKATIITNTYATWDGIFQGNGNAVTQIGQCASSGAIAWSTTKGNATTYNVFYDAAGAGGAGYYFENKSGVSIHMACVFLGSTLASGL